MTGMPSRRTAATSRHGAHVGLVRAVKPWGAWRPNSAHQLWTEWAWVIQVVGGWGGLDRPVFPAVKAGLTAFFVEIGHGHAALS